MLQSEKLAGNDLTASDEKHWGRWRESVVAMGATLNQLIPAAKQIHAIIHEHLTMEIVRRFLIVTALPAFLLTGCGSEPDQKELKSFVQENVKECGGEVVGDVVTVREELLSNKHVGYAHVKIRGNDYYPDLVAYVGDKNSFWQLSKDPCALADLQNFQENP